MALELYLNNQIFVWRAEGRGFAVLPSSSRCLLFRLHSFQTFVESLLHVKSYGGHLEIKQEPAVPPSSYCSGEEGESHTEPQGRKQPNRILSGILLWVVG